MGLFDLASPPLSWLDGALAAALPDAGRLVLWGLLAAAVSMALYAVLSPQHRLRRAREEAVAARRALDAHEGSFEEAWPLMRRMFSMSVKQLGLVLTPAVAASLPLLFMLTWLYGAFSYTLPDHAGAVALRTTPGGYKASIRPGQLASTAADAIPGAPMLVVQDGRGRVIDERPMNAPVTTLHKERWWNLLIANPIGYLADDSPLELIEIDLPRREVIAVGPWWLRTWEFVFFTTLVAASLAIKLMFRLV